jgi:hypothetical protein
MDGRCSNQKHTFDIATNKTGKKRTIFMEGFLVLHSHTEMQQGKH